MHIVTKNFKLQSYSLGALPLRDLPHNQESISEIWLRECTDTLRIDSNCMQPVITTNGVSNMAVAGCHASGWFWMWCICHILYLAVQAGWEAIQRETDLIPRVKKFLPHMHQSPKDRIELKNCLAAALATNAP